MVAPWVAAAVAVPIVVTKSVLSMRVRHRRDSDSERDDTPADHFVCERVCTTDRLLRRMGTYAKDPTPDTCITVCGVSAHDACVEACQRTVCAVSHQVPAWNETCLSRCKQECLKGRGS